jgi:hypothetical protein
VISGIIYQPSEDQEILSLHPNHFSGSNPKAEKGRFRIWWDDEGVICAVTISEFTKELEEFKRRMHSVRLGGIWKGLKITERDIAEARGSMRQRLDKKWSADVNDLEAKTTSKKRSLKRR